jgi:hypothetical protein
MDQLAIVNDRNGEVKPQGDRVLTPADIAAIQNWLDNRVALLARRDIDDIHRAVYYLNITRQWVQSKASDDQLEDVTNTLLLAMHDLRTVLVRKTLTACWPPTMRRNTATTKPCAAAATGARLGRHRRRQSRQGSSS